MKSIKDKAIEYAKTKHTNQNLIEIVSWDFEAGANYVLEEVEDIIIDNYDNTINMARRLINCIKELKK